ncbi:hypothetical protein CCP1ISM_4550001 [Azospirillaceae bacterium]
MILDPCSKFEQEATKGDLMKLSSLLVSALVIGGMGLGIPYPPKQPPKQIPPLPQPIIIKEPIKPPRMIVPPGIHFPTFPSFADIESGQNYF